MERVNGMIRGAREGYLFPNPSAGSARGGLSVGGGASWEEWGRFDARQHRYLFFWGLSQQAAYRDVLGTGLGHRSAYGLYEGVRDLFGVAYQLGEFWTSHLHGGDLDPLMGDGKTAPSALPILMDAEDAKVREALAELAKRSNLQIAKDVASRYGATMGDTFWETCDDAAAKTIRLNPSAPGRVKWCDTSAEGNVEAYEFQFMRPDPRQDPHAETINGPRLPEVTYNELVTPLGPGKGYRWRTYLNGTPFAWPGNESADFTVPDLPFAPLVKVQHKNIGMGWGQAEAAGSLPGGREAADLASVLTDWSRKAMNAPHMIAGALSPDDDPLAQARAASWPATAAQNRSGSAGEFAPYNGGQSRAEADARGKTNYLYFKDPQVRAHTLVHHLPVGDIGGQIDRIVNKNLADYPELKFQQIQLSGDASGESFREARKAAEAKVASRRVEYDAGIARAMKMAITYGGLRGYRHYEGFTAADYDAGRLDFRVGNRPAFAPDPTEEIAERQARYASMQAAVTAGLPLALAMREAGYGAADIAEAKAHADEMAKQVQSARFSEDAGAVPSP